MNAASPTPLAARLAARIRARGPLDLADYMAAALGDPDHGYYTTHDPIGAAGDFVTAPEISQMFGELIGLWLVDRWRALGASGALAAPCHFHLVEFGPGRGVLMDDALRAIAGAAPDMARAARLALVESSPVLRAAQARRLGARGANWVDDFDDVPEGPLLAVANEFFDALPARQARRDDDGWRTRVIDVGATGALRLDWSAPAPQPPSDLPPVFHRAPKGAVCEFRPRGEALVGRLAARLAEFGGAALIVDYGHAASAVGDTLQAVRGHQPADPMAAPGEADLTAHVDFGALAAAAAAAGARVLGPVEQGFFLSALGVEHRAAALKTARPQDGEEIDAALARLCGAGAMGRLFKVMGLADMGAAPAPGF